MLNLKLKASLIVLILTSLTLQCQGQLQVMSALNEVRTINLVKEFGIAVSNYSISSSTQSVFELIQPLISSQDDNFFASSRSLTQSQLQIDGQMKQQLQLYYDQGSTILSLVQVVKNNDSQTISEIAQLNLNQAIQGADLFEAVLCYKNTGILLYTIKENSFVRLITLDTNNKIQLSLAVQLQKKSQFLKCSRDLSKQNFYFIVQEIDTFNIQLRTITLQGQVSDILDNIQMCSYIKNPKVNYVDNYKQGFLIMCQQEMEFKYNLYYSDTNQNKIVQLQIEDTLNYETSAILSVDSINNVIYLVSSLYKIQNQIRVTQLTINKNKQVINYSYDTISIPINSNNIINTFISGYNDLITIVTNNIIVGVSISESSVVFQIQNQQIPNYTAFASNLYGEQIAIQYVQSSKTPNYTTKFIQTNIPKLIFTQNSQQEQVYSLGFVNDALKIQNTISANLITDNSNEVIIKNSNANFYTVQSQASYEVNLPIEKYFIGYITNGYVSDTFKNADLQSLEQRFIQKSSEIQKVFSTFTPNFLSQSLNDQQNQYTITISSTSFNNKQIYEHGKITLKTPLLSVDEQSGYFVNTNSKGEKQINVFFYQQLEDNMYQFATINPACNGQSALLYSGDTLNNQVVVLCNTQLKVYRFSQMNDFIVNSYTLDYPIDKIVGTIAKIEIQPSGLLYITDNKSIIAIDINLNIFVGQVFIPANPQGQFTGKIIFFTESFIVARNDNNSPIIQQFSYNEFNGTQAIMIRQFFNFGYNNWIENGFQSIKNFSLNSKKEFLIVDQKIDDENIRKLFYRVSISGNIQAQNQLFTTMNLYKSTFFFASPSMVGINNDMQYVIFELFYSLTMETQININPTTFDDQIENIITGQLTLNEKYQINLKLYSYRSVSASQTHITNTSDLTSYFSNTIIQLPFSYQFDDKNFSNCHLFGWDFQLDFIQNNYRLSFTQRIINELNQANKNLQKSLNQIMVMPNALMISTSEGIFIEKQTLSSTYQPNCQFIIEGGKLDIRKTIEGKTIVKKNVKTISLDYLQSNTITLTNYSIQGTYDQYPNSQPTITLVQKQSYTYVSKILLFQTIVTIISDNSLGLLALLQESGGSSSQVCKIELLENADQSTFSLDCRVYESISNLLITNIIYIESASQNIFVSQNLRIYYGFTIDLSQYSVIDLGNFFNEKGVLIYQNQNINYAQKFSESSVLISFFKGNSFIITLQFNNNQILINDTIQTLYVQLGLQFVGAFYKNQSNQIFQLSKQMNDPTIYHIVMYEQYNKSKNDYLIRSSYRFTYQKELTSSIISWYNGQLILGMNNLYKDSVIPSTFSISDKPILNINSIEQNNPLSTETTVVFPFAIKPLYQSNSKIQLKAQIKNNPNISPIPATNSNTLSYSIILTLVLFCFN